MSLLSVLGRFYAFEKADRLDPLSSGCDPTLKGRVKKSDAREVQKFYQQYYKKHIKAVQNAAVEADR
jgi:callose synthase